MCTMIVTQVAIEGSGKGAKGWFKLREANVSYDHPFDAPLEHALNIDFVNEALGPGARVAVELSVESPFLTLNHVRPIARSAPLLGQLAEEAARNRKDIFTMDALAWAYYRAGRLSEAEQASRQARRTGTVDRRILAHASAIEQALNVHSTR